MKKLNLVFIISITVCILLMLFPFRLDLTQEGRYTLSNSSIKILKEVKKPMKIKVFLEGDFPASFKQLQSETAFLLEEFRKVNSNIDYEFIDPIATKMSQDTLIAMGISPSKLPDYKDGKISQIILFPYASINYKGFSGSLPLIIDQKGISASEQLNKSIENLEYNFVSNIKSLVSDQKKNIGILVNQNELGPKEFGSFVEMALENYNVGPVLPQSALGLEYSDFEKLKKMDAIVVAKPREKFTDAEKVILDQYLMNGGKTLWMIDAVNAEMDTLFRSSKILANPYEINLTDLLFNYGIRVNTNLVKDMQKSAMLRIQSGEVQGNPQYQNLLWPYFPLGIGSDNHPITKNINPVKLEFPSAIDTLSRKGIKHNVLFESSERTIVKTTPVYISIEEMADLDSLQMSEKASKPKIFATISEGKFSSAYANRTEKNEFPNFKAESQNTKMIVISDGDVAKNAIMKGEMLPLGFDLLTNQNYGNAQFLQNCLDYLLDDSNLMQLRNRHVELRLLDKKRIEEEKSKWQIINCVLPLVFCGISAYLFALWRKRKYA